jgi:hypothetical protein
MLCNRFAQTASAHATALSLACSRLMDDRQKSQNLLIIKIRPGSFMTGENLAGILIIHPRPAND